jgi:hypothetical protein
MSRALASRNLFPVSPVIATAGPLVVNGDTGDALLNACRSAQRFLDLAELAFCCGRRDAGNVFLNRASDALDAVL